MPKFMDFYLPAARASSSLWRLACFAEVYGCKIGQFFVGVWRFEYRTYHFVPLNEIKLFSNLTHYLQGFWGFGVLGFWG